MLRVVGGRSCGVPSPDAVHRGLVLCERIQPYRRSTIVERLRPVDGTGLKCAVVVAHELRAVQLWPASVHTARSSR